MHRIILMLLLCGSLALAACSGGTGDSATNSSNNNRASQQANTGGAANTGQAQVGQMASDVEVVRASAAEVALSAGGRIEAEVRLDIIDGYHVNANPPTDKNLIGTQLTVAAVEGVEAGAPVYPRALLKKFEFDERPLAVYEREAIIKLPLRADAKAAKGRQMLQARVRVQPCNDQACLPPRVIETTIPLTIN